MLKRFLKNQRGLTLIELLVVIVILGIIAAIAVPSIGGILNNSKVDAHIANANQMISATRLAVTAGGGAGDYTMDKLIKDGYLEGKPTDPSGAEYDDASSKVVVGEDANSNYTYTVTLAKGNAAADIYINGATQAQLTRKNVKLDGNAPAAVD